MANRVFDIAYEPLPAQLAFHNSPAKIRAYVGGYGCGKTYSLCMDSLVKSVENAGLRGMLVAPTYRMLEDVTLQTMLEILEANDIPHQFLSSKYLIRLPWKSEVMFRSAEKPQRLKGSNLAWAGIDEAALVTKEAWDALIARVRHPRAKKHSLTVATTPEGLNWLYDEFVGDNKDKGSKDIVFARTLDNTFLSSDYAEMLMASYAKEQIAAYLEGRFVNMYSGMVYPGFNRDVHAAQVLEYDEALPTYACIDFNVDPMHCAIVQPHGNELWVVDEVVIKSSNTTELAQELTSRYPKREILAFPDPSGKARKTAASPGAPSDFHILREHGFEIRAKNANPAVRDRLNAVNAKLMNGKGVVSLFISKKCKTTIKSFEMTRYKAGTNIVDKDASVEHMTDAIGYMVEYLFPIRRPVSHDSSL